MVYWEVMTLPARKRSGTCHDSSRDCVFLISLVLFAEGCSRKTRPIDTGDESACAGVTARTVKAKNGAGTFTIGKSTTHITRPPIKNGYIDYAAALDER